MTVLALLAWLAAGCAAPAPVEPAEEAAAAGPAAAEMERLRALPYVDFVEEEPGGVATGLTVSRPGGPTRGHTLHANGTLCSADLLDDRGEVVHTWSRPPCKTWGYAALLPGGRLLVNGKRPLEIVPGRSLVKEAFLLWLSWEGEVLREVDLPVHHAFQVLDDGRILALTERLRRVPEYDPGHDILDNEVVLLDPEGGILEAVSLYDVLSRGGAGFRLDHTGVALREKEGGSDLFHANAVEWMPFPDLAGRSPAHTLRSILVTVRHQDALVVFDWESRKILWAWGKGEMEGPHDAQWLANGRILVFDNGMARRWSRILEVDPATGQIAWEYRDPDPTSFYTLTSGAVQRLANGDTLVSESNDGRAFEVTPAGEIVWEYVNPRRDAGGRRAVIVKMMQVAGPPAPGLASTE